MKRFGLCLLFFIFLCASVWGEDYTWTGNGSDNDWHNHENWDKGSPGTPAITDEYPGSAADDTATIGSGGEVEINAAVTLTSIDNSGTLTIGANTVTATTITNSGTLSLVGVSSQIGSHSSMGGTVEFTDNALENGTTFSGITNFNNLIIHSGARTGVGDISVSGSFALNGGSLNATSLTVTGTSTISGNITTSGAQTYNDVVTLSGTPELTSTGDSVTTNGIVTTSNGVSIKASGDIAAAGIDAGTGGDIRLESTGGNITLNGAVTGNQLIAIASGTVTFTVSASSTINTSSNGTEGESASIYIKAGTFVVSGTTTGNYIIPGSSGQLCLMLNTAYANTALLDTVVGTARWHQHSPITITKDLVYSTGPAESSYTVGSGTITDFDYVDSTDSGITNDEFNVPAGKNVYIINVSTTSRAVTFNVNGAGIIEIQGSYEPSSTLTLQPGAGGIVLNNANINITGNFNTGTAALALRGTGNSITAASVTINGASGVGNFAVNASGDIAAAGISAGTGGDIRLESTGGNITLGGAVKGNQLIAIASGNVTVGASGTIETSSNGDEGESASIYIKAGTFVVSNSTADSIIPGSSGQLCLMLNTAWTDTNSVVESARWHQDHTPSEIKILYSFTEDADGDGRLDRIRVQASAALSGAFAGLVVTVDGYVVTGITAVPSNNDSFYINLTPKSELDGGNTPTWSVTDPGSLLIDSASINKNFTPTDTIPPRIAHTITLPDHPETYVQMSEPVTGGTFNVSGKTVLSAVQIGAGYLLSFNNPPFSLNELVINNITSATLVAGYFSVTGMKDLSTPIVPESGDPLPKYPVNWNYSSYSSTATNRLIPPHDLININNDGSISTAGVIRRVTDVLVSIPPYGLDTDDFAFPVSASNGSNNIFDFDGSASLPESAPVVLQARINAPTISGSDTLRLLYKTAARGSPSVLWQPFPAWYYFAPDLAWTMLTGVAVPMPPSSYNYTFPAINSGNRVEFYFHIGSGTPSKQDQFIARLNVRSGIPLNWYTLVRPFYFNIQDVRPQRGGVTIRNNVINSDEREEAFIDINLARPGRVTIQVYTLDGTVVKSIMRNAQQPAGEQTFTWDGTNNAGRSVARGMYFVRVVGPDIDEIRQIMVIR